jgi:adenylylsulfate kinase-like enzyme
MTRIHQIAGRQLQSRPFVVVFSFLSPRSEAKEEAKKKLKEKTFFRGLSPLALATAASVLAGELNPIFGIHVR